MFVARRNNEVIGDLLAKSLSGLSSVLLSRSIVQKVLVSTTVVSRYVYKLDFYPHISNICKKAATQLNALKRLKSFIGFREKKVLFRALSI